jgi:hypothetical protein
MGLGKVVGFVKRHKEKIVFGVGTFVGAIVSGSGLLGGLVEVGKALLGTGQ